MDTHELEKRVRDVYKEQFQSIAERCSGTGEIPGWVLKIDVQGKTMTSSSMENFKDAISCYGAVIPQSLQSKSPGALGASTVVAEPAVLYVPANASFKPHDAFGNKSVMKIEAVQLVESNSKKQPERGHTMESASIVMTPITFGELCIAIVVTYDKYSFQQVEFDSKTGEKKGIVQAYSIDFSKAASGG